MRRTISEMFMGTRAKPKRAYVSCISSSFALFLLLFLYQTVSLFSFTTFFPSYLSFPINLTQILVDEGYRRVIYQTIKTKTSFIVRKYSHPKVPGVVPPSARRLPADYCQVLLYNQPLFYINMTTYCRLNVSFIYTP